MNATFVSYMKALKRSENTITAYLHDVQSCLDFIGKNDKDITYADLINYQASISDMSTATVSRKIAAIKVYFKFLNNMGIISNVPTANWVAPKIKHKEKFALTPEQIRNMVSVATNLRDKAIITVMASTGMRISEVKNLTLEQYKSAVDGKIIINGKGDKDRVVVLNAECVNRINDYMKIRKNGEWLFINNQNHQMDAKCVSGMLKKCAKKAGIENWEEISNHYLRTAFATMQSENGTPVEVISKMMGHSNVATTMNTYIKINQNRMVDAFNKSMF